MFDLINQLNIKSIAMFKIAYYLILTTLISNCLQAVAQIVAQMGGGGHEDRGLLGNLLGR